MLGFSDAPWYFRVVAVAIVGAGIAKNRVVAGVKAVARKVAGKKK